MTLLLGCFQTRTAFFSWSSERFDWDNLWVCFGVRLLLVVVVVVGGVVVVAQFGSLLGGTTRLINKMCESDATSRRWTLFVLQPQADDAAGYDLLLHTHATLQYPIKPRECRRFRFLPRPTINCLPASVGCPFFQRHGTLYS